MAKTQLATKSQREVRLELEIGGQSRPLLFDFIFLDYLTEEVPLDELDILALNKPWRLIPPVTLAAIKSGAEFEGSKEKFDIKTVTAWVQQTDPLLLNKILEGYRTAMGFIGVALRGNDAVSQAAPAESQNP